MAKVKAYLPPTESEIKDQMYDAIESSISGSKCPFMSYEQGVRAALMWVLGETEDKPIEEI